MEYERIHKVQTGIISPSKLRMKLMGPHHLMKKDGSNSNSSRTSPSKHEDCDFVKNSLLANGDEEAISSSVTSHNLEVPEAKLPGALVKEKESSLPKENNGDAARARLQQSSKGDSSNSSSVHPVRIMEDDNLDYDSNASSSSFEFHKGERSVNSHISRSISRPMPSKWNDAEKWIMSRQNVQANHPKRNALQNQTNRMTVANMVKVAPESAICENRFLYGKAADTKRVDFCQPAPSQLGFDKFSFDPAVSHSAQSRDLEKSGNLACSNGQAEEASDFPAIRSVSMRDMGTEMTPATSLEPSMTSTPIGASTPIRSPTSSMPSTPRGGAPAPTPMEPSNGENSQLGIDYNKRELTEEELKLKTRREIVALGVQLGKMNIAAWASKDEQENERSCAEMAADAAELQRVEYQKRAAVWEEAEKSKHTARYKREEIKIQAWESQQKAKLEAELRRIEAQVEQMRAQAQAKMVKKIAMTRQRSEEKRASAEVRKTRDAERTAAQAEYIRQTGKMPSSQLMCCGWL